VLRDAVITVGLRDGKMTELCRGPRVSGCNVTLQMLQSCLLLEAFAWASTPSSRVWMA